MASIEETYQGEYDVLVGRTRAHSHDEMRVGFLSHSDGAVAAVRATLRANQSDPYGNGEQTPLGKRRIGRRLVPCSPLRDAWATGLDSPDGAEADGPLPPRACFTDVVDAVAAAVADERAGGGAGGGAAAARAPPPPRCACRPC